MTTAVQHRLEQAEDRAVRAPAKRRSLWWVVHHWAGLKLSLFLTWVLLTGTLAVFAVEYDWLARPAMRVTPAAAPQASWGTLLEAAQAAVPGGTVSALHAPPHAWFAVEASAKAADGHRVRIYLNPYSGRVQGTGQWLSFHRFFREMHRHLLLPAKIGIPIVTSLSVVLLASLVTGLVTYKKFWRGFFKRPRARNARILTGDLHRLGGIWSIWFVGLIALTGFWYLVETLGGAAPDLKPPKADKVVAELDAATIDSFAATAGRAFPGLDIREMRLPEKPGKPLGFLGQAQAVLVRDRANGVWMDPTTGKVLDVVKGEALTAHQRISEAADPLHFGTWGGMVTKMIWFVFGAVLTALSITGVMVLSLRLRAAYGAETLSPRSGLACAWQGMGVSAYPSAALIILSLAMLPGWFTG